MDIEEYKKLARNKIEADTLTQQVRDVIKITKWQKQDMREGFKETFKPLIKSQDSIKKSIDEQQNATLSQLKKNQLTLTQGLNQNRLAITEGFDKLDEIKRWDLTQLLGFEAIEDTKKDKKDKDLKEDEDPKEDQEAKERLPPTQEKIIIKPEYFDQYQNNKESYDIRQKLGYDKLPSFYYGRDITILGSVIDSVSNKFNEYINDKLKNTANFNQYPNSGYVEATAINRNPRKETLNKIKEFNILSSYLNQLQKLNQFKLKTGTGMIYFKNPYQLLDRLKLLGGSILAGNNGVLQEFSQIAHLLNQMKVITKKQLNELIKTYITNR